MRRVIVGAIAAMALAWGQSGRADDAAKQQSKTSAQQQPGSQSAGTARARESGTGGTDQTSREMRSDSRANQDAARAQGGERRDLFQGKKNFDVSGRVAHASAGEVTIDRKDLPPATLKVEPGTKIQVDGKRASADQLQAGQEVRASFNLRGGNAEAVELKAKKAKQDDTQKLHEQRQDTRKDLQKDMQKRQ
jgi:hypothetical protein